MLELMIEPEPFAWEAAWEGEILDGPQFAGLTLAERKAIAITSTLETGEAGGFYGLSSNFDGKGLSFGLVNWNIGSGSLQPLLRDFFTKFPDRWNAAFGVDADRFKEVIEPDERVKANRKRQLEFVRKEANTQVWSKAKNKNVWVVVEPWKTYFQRLAVDPEFQKIQVRYVHGIIANAKRHCDRLGLKSERAFCFMFDACSSHGQWWNTKNDREKILQAKLALERVKSFGSLSERAILTAVAETLRDTVLPEWRERVYDRKMWFLTGELPGQKERDTKLRAIPLTDEPFTISTVAPVGGYDPMIDASIITSFARGARNYSDLASEAFYFRHPERKRAPIRASESAAKREWAKLRTRATQLFPNLAEKEFDDELEDGSVMGLLKSFITGGERDPSKLATEAFYALHPERKRSPINAKREPGAVKEWKQLRAHAAQALPVEPPKLLRSESSPLGTTHFFAINLGIPNVEPTTAVFVPHGYRQGPTVDLILYLHGHASRTTPVSEYLVDKRAPVRERVAASAKNVILVVPSLSKSSDAGTLVEKGGLDRYLAIVLTGLGALQGKRQKLRHLVLAGHSGGGRPMATLAQREDRAAVENVRECWGFDSFYNLIDANKWAEWARRYPDRTLFGFVSDSPKDVINVIKGANASNLRVKAARRYGHWLSIGDEMTDLINKAAFLDPR